MFRSVWLLAFVLLIESFGIRCFAAEVETDLNGFRLFQDISVIESLLGKSIKTIDMEKQVLNVYQVDHDSYMVVGHNKKFTNNISTLQLSGTNRKVLPFKNLLLGDSKDKVEQSLGRPDHIQAVEDFQSPKLSRYEYDGRNYTVEIDENGKLYSIRIFVTAEMMTKTDASEEEWNNFKKAIFAKNFTLIADEFRPDAEIYKTGKTYSINTRYSDFVKNPDKNFVSAILSDKGSVLQEITRTEPVQEFRLDENLGVGIVYKFPTGKILKEISFFPYKGKYRVYEIAFQDGESK